MAVPKGFNSRPTTNFSKEALFNIIDNRFDLENKRILDLCSGTGNISLEFVSGDAAHVLAVEQNFKCVRFLQGLAKELDIENELSVLKSDVVQFLERTELKFDFIFADPPYDVPIHEQIVNLVFDRNLLNKDGILVIEHGKGNDFSQHPRFDFDRKYGAVHFAFFQ